MTTLSGLTCFSFLPGTCPRKQGKFSSRTTTLPSLCGSVQNASLHLIFQTLPSEIALPLDLRLFKCRASGEFELDSASSDGTTIKSNAKANLAIGSPIVILEAPPMLKTAEPMPMMRPNRGLIKAGDAGRIIDRRPKDVWAIRFAVGAYLIDGKYFEPLIEK